MSATTGALPRVAVLGTGIMGRQMARRLAEHGAVVSVWNRTRAGALPLEAHGITVADDPKGACRDADVAIVMVTDGPSSDAVVLGDGGALTALAGRSGPVCVVMSSIPVETAEAQGAAAARCGVAYIDAPVSGGEPGARDGTLAIMAGGAEPDIEALRPVFDVLGRVTRVGPVGAGSLAKLANQMIVGVTISAIAEALLLVERGGGDPGAFISAVAGGFADGPLLRNHGQRMVDRDFEPGAMATIQLKDLATALATGARLGSPMPVTGETRALYDSLCASGDGARDHNAVLLELLRRTGQGDIA
ncbi:MAG: NAD(P)-dependent oxidoreductase [Pseudomonadota bacterium]